MGREADRQEVAAENQAEVVDVVARTVNTAVKPAVISSADGDQAEKLAVAGAHQPPPEPAAAAGAAAA